MLETELQFELLKYRTVTLVWNIFKGTLSKVIEIIAKKYTKKCKKWIA
jgi:hypothetical protein